MAVYPLHLYVIPCKQDLQFKTVQAVFAEFIATAWFLFFNITLIQFNAGINSTGGGKVSKNYAKSAHSSFEVPLSPPGDNHVRCLYLRNALRAAGCSKAAGFGLQLRLQ